MNGVVRRQDHRGFNAYRYTLVPVLDNRFLALVVLNRPTPFVASASVSKIKPALITVQYLIAVDSPKDKPSGFNLAVGIVIDPKGIVIAPYDNPKQAVSFEIVLGNGTKIPAKVMLADASVGVAILKIEGEKLFPAAELADSDGVEKGDSVIALGRSQGFSPHTVAMAIVSAKNRLLRSGERVLQVDSTIGPGLSAGLLLDLNGKLLGVLPKAGGIGQATPSNRLKELVSNLPKQPKDK